MNNEPVSIWAAINAALIATWNIVALLAEFEPELSQLVNVALGAWVLVISFYVRSRVTPVGTNTTDV